MKPLTRSRSRRDAVSSASVLLAAGVVSLLLASAPASMQSQDEPPETIPPQAESLPQVRATLAQAPTTDVPLDGCMTAECHQIDISRQVQHGPIHVDACDACHTLTDPQTHTFTPIRPPEQLCLFCHELEIHEDLMTHAPITSGECLACHDPHGGSGPSLLRSDHYSDMCTSCHSDFVGARNLTHGPALAGACGACHLPHAAPNPELLATDGRALCLSCHVKMEIQIETGRVVHEPVLDNCRICHDPHAMDSAALLIEEPPGLCVSCHEDIAHTIDTAITQHGAITSEGACLNCHDPHASDYPRLLKNDVSSLCFQCHDKEIELEDGTKLANMKAIIESGSSLHGAIAEDNCVACHEIHGGGNRRLLVREYSDALYFPFQESAYALCFGCHDKALVTLEKTTTATGFRNGSTNLHYVHVNRDKKGRTCHVCHDSHASDRDRHIHDTVPFGPGGWKLPIGFERIGDGGSCASGCHTSVLYNRSTPVIYPPRLGVDDKGRGNGKAPGKRKKKRKK